MNSIRLFHGVVNSAYNMVNWVYDVVEGKLTCVGWFTYATFFLETAP